MIGVIRKVDENTIKDAIPEISEWNHYLDIRNVTKYFGTGTVDWYALYRGKREMVALAAVAKPGNSPVSREIFVNQVCAKSGNGYGRILLKNLYKHFNSKHPEGFEYFGFTSNPEAESSLLDYYMKWFGKEDGWNCWKTRMGWDHFQKKFN